MPKKRIAIIGAGNAGCLTAIHFYLFGRDYFDISIYHNPVDSPIERVGQGTTITPTRLIASFFGANWYDNPIGATFKSGILYEGWGKKHDKIFHPFDMAAMSTHYVPQKLSNAILKCGFFDVIETTINDPEKEIDADYIFDCRGRHNRDKSNYRPLLSPLNSVLLCKKEGSDPDLKYTRSVTTPNGWTFIIPNTDSVSYGYLYNNNITSKEDATEDFLERFNLPETDGELSFENYMCNNIFVGERTILNGNRAGFLEPLEATSTRFYEAINRQGWDALMTDAHHGVLNQNVQDVIKEIETFVLWHYQNGSKYESPFWDYVKSIPFNPDEKFTRILKQSRTMTYNEMDTVGVYNPDGTPQGDGYGTLWSLKSFKNWDEGVTLPKKTKRVYFNGRFKGFGKNTRG